MKTTDWKFDFTSLPHWEVRDSIPFVYDEFYEIPQSDALCCLYSICEASMCNYVGFLAVLVNKEDPSLLFPAPQNLVFTPNFSVSSDGKLIFLQASIYNSENNSRNRPIVIIDISRKVFSYIPTENTNPYYEISELTENEFAVSADDIQKENNRALKKLCKQKIRIDRLKWYDIDCIASLKEIVS